MEIPRAERGGRVVQTAQGRIRSRRAFRAKPAGGSHSAAPMLRFSAFTTSITPPPGARSTVLTGAPAGIPPFLRSLKRGLWSPVGAAPEGAAADSPPATEARHGIRVLETDQGVHRAGQGLHGQARLPQREDLLGAGALRSHALAGAAHHGGAEGQGPGDRKSTRLNSSHSQISYA